MENTEVEHEICGNCKKEIPQHNYVMHTAHCARNITLCPVCKEPIPKSQFEGHRGGCVAVKRKSPVKAQPLAAIEKSVYFGERKAVEDKKAIVRKEKKMEKLEKFVDVGHLMKSAPKKPTGLLACKYCDLELPKLELEEHENYCGARTDKCLECGELVMFKYKQIHMDSNHGFLKLKDEPGPRPSWDSTTQRSSAPEVTSPRRRPPPFSGIDSTLYSFPTSYSPTMGPPGKPKEKSESYKDISRRLDCKTEYIRNLLHDSASITAPLRHNGAVPRNHFNHNKEVEVGMPDNELTIPCEFCTTPIPSSDLIQHQTGCRPDVTSFTPLSPAPQPPRRRRNPPTELTIPCEFCNTPIPHEDLIEHETGCRPDFARFNRRQSPEEDDYFVAPPPSSPEVELPCEFCCDMIPASQLLRHQATCT